MSVQAYSRDGAVRRGSPSEALLMPVMAVALAVVAARVVTEPRGAALLLPLAAGALAVGLGLVAPKTLLYTLVVWLVVLGSVRRLSSGLGSTPLGDPLLLVGPAAVGVLTIVAVQRGAFRRRTWLANAVPVFCGFMLLGTVNPLQGSVLVGVAGLLFTLVPLLGFWIGRSLCDDRTMTAIFKLVAALGVVAVVYGMWQTWVGFPSWDSRWIAEHRETFLALVVNDRVVRPFATFIAPSEYALFLSLAAVVWVGFGLKRGWTGLAVPVLGLFAVALAYSSARAVVVLFVFALGLMFAARRRLPLLVSLGVAAVLLIGVSVASSRFAPANEGTEALLQHQAAGLADPLNPESSSLVGHYQLLKLGLAHAIHEPLGVGTGSVSQAGAKYGLAGAGGNTELDPSNAATAFGVAGLVVYLAILVLAFRQAFALATMRRDALAIVALGFVAATTFQWLNGGQYAVALLVWLVIGWVDATSSAAARKPV